MTNLRPPTRTRNPGILETCSECDHGPEGYPQPRISLSLRERIIPLLLQPTSMRPKPVPRCARFAVGFEHDICHCTSSFHSA